jgi:ubiquinol-cytochrome c reductase cytochrome b subunit
MGWLDGLVRMSPPLETHAFGHTISWNILLPGLIIPGIIFTGMALYPFIESWLSGDKREHHLLDRPRNVPNRTALGVMSLTFMVIAMINGGNDIIATHFDLSINQIMWFSRIGIIVLPPLAFVITKRICLSLQRADRELVLHGKETGRLVMLPHGEFIEVHEELSAEKKFTLTQHEQPKAIALVKEDVGGVLNPKGIRARLQARFSAANAENIAKPTATEVKELEGGHH